MNAIAIPRLGRRWITEYARRPLNVVLLIVVPVVFVTLSAGALADFADILGGRATLGEVEAATAGWAAAVLAGVAAFFHVSQSRVTDRRLAVAGAGALRVVVSRLASTLLLAGAASGGALLALGVRTDLATSTRVVAATVVSAVIYTGLGVLVGSTVRSEMNGSLIIVFAWIFDVFFGPAMGGTAQLLRIFPLHYPTLVLTGVASGHSGLLGDVGISAAWGTASMMLAALALIATTRRHPPRTRLARRSTERLTAALAAAGRQLRRMPVLWILIVGLPVAFISASIAVTPETPTPVDLVEQGRRTLTIQSMADVHGAVMVPITIGFLASLAGLFVILESAQADRRLALTDYRPGEILTVRMTTIVIATLIATAVGLAVTAASFDAANWWLFAAANVIVGLTYATIGVIIGPVFGRLGGLYLLLLLPFIDIGLAQNAMFDAAPPEWGRFLPAHGAMRVAMDAAFTPGFDEIGSLVLALVWLTTLTGLASLVFRRVMTR
jgi:hypothetical protein